MRDPFSDEAEQSLLGAMMLAPEMIDLLCAELVVDDFYRIEHVQIYRAILARHNTGKTVDPVTVSDDLQTLERTGGGQEPAIYYLSEIYQNTPSTANALAYAQIVRERSVDRSLIAAGDRIRELGHTGAELADKISAAQSLVLGLDSRTSVPEVRPAVDVLSDHLEELQRRHDLQGALDGLSTGSRALDHELSGLKGGDLIIIAGRPSMGKTAFAVNIAEHVAVQQDSAVLIVSLEMTNGALMDRLLASIGQIPLRTLKDGTAAGGYAVELNAAAGQIKRSKLYMADRPGITVARLRAMARRHKQRFGLRLLVLDYLQLMEGSSREGNRTQDVSDMSRQLKLMARELDMPVIALSQLNRSLEQRPNKRPIMSDLRESGALEQDADVILFIYRDEVYHPQTEAKGIAEIIIGKARNGELGTVRMAFIGQFCCFEDLTGSEIETSNRPMTRAPLADRYKGSTRP
ncbi:replicative DNA helicase [Pseudomonas fluorescens]|uniref:Replicative DNA helicase n=1 Tax=Pseudomonas fluorescens TaxID=294 RepID=A0A0F4TRL9_PSEFL|nr:replicative DNA helicase [Pseudomonas fluorescens]KJZ46017.1 DNA helicase [Pseudomonas fluorescens]